MDPLLALIIVLCLIALGIALVSRSAKALMFTGLAIAVLVVLKALGVP